MNFSENFLSESISILSAIDTQAVERCASGLATVRDAGGRLFILGVGGSAAHASHTVNDFRKICQFEAYTPTDNVAELTARANDEGWDTTFVDWLRGWHLSQSDAILVFSVGGGDPDLRRIYQSRPRPRARPRSRDTHFWGRRPPRRLHSRRCRRVRVLIPRTVPRPHHPPH